MTNKEDGNSEVQMEGGELSLGYANRGTSESKRSLTNMESVADDILFEILLHLPAEDIYNGARLVCKKWCKIIHNRNFINAHLHRSTPRLVIQITHRSTRGLVKQISPLSKRPIFATVRHGRIEKFNFDCEFVGSGKGCSCNGLILGFDATRDDAMYIANPVTKKRFALPPSFETMYSSAIAYAAASMRYKVVQLYACMDKNPVVRGCAILTAGVDNSWRHLRVERLPPLSRSLIHDTAVTTEGFIHWTTAWGSHVLTLDIETEIITETPVPDGYHGQIKVFLSTGTTLTLLVRCTEYLWEVLELKQEEREWIKLTKVDLRPQKGKIVPLFGRSDRYVLKPVGWLNCKEMLVLQVSSEKTNVLLLYNIRTQEIVDFFVQEKERVDFYVIDEISDRPRLYLYRSSMVWPDGC